MGFHRGVYTGTTIGDTNGNAGSLDDSSSYPAIAVDTPKKTLHDHILPKVSGTWGHTGFVELVVSTV